MPKKNNSSSSSSALYTTEPDGYVEPHLAEAGLAASKPTTVVEIFEATARRHGSRGALYLKRPVDVIMTLPLFFFRASHSLVFYRERFLRSGRSGHGQNIFATAKPSPKAFSL